MPAKSYATQSLICPQSGTTCIKELNQGKWDKASELVLGYVEIRGRTLSKWTKFFQTKPEKQRIGKIIPYTLGKQASKSLLGIERVAPPK